MAIRSREQNTHVHHFRSRDRLHRGRRRRRAGFYLYKKNEAQVNDWLRSQSINLPFTGAQSKDESGKSIEELLREKERLEDLIAEREMAEKAKTQTARA